MRPGKIDGSLAKRAMAAFQRQPQAARFIGLFPAGGFVRRRWLLGGGWAGVGDAVEGRLRFSAAGDEVESAVGAEGEVGDIKGAALEKGLGGGAIAGAA